jgi:dihydroorotate dehydrogenase electron transfer subunit
MLTYIDWKSQIVQECVPASNGWKKPDFAEGVDINKQVQDMGKQFHEQFEVVKVVEEARDLRRIVFNKPLRSEPGQFVMLWIPGASERPLSVMNDSPLELVIKRYGGAFTDKVFKLYPGQRLFVRGPYGNSFMPFVKEDGRKFLVCGGCGVVPLAFLASRLKGQDVWVLMGAKCREELPPMFSKLDPLISTDDGSAGVKGFVTDLMDRVRAGRQDQFFICGPEGMMAIAAEKAERHVPAENIIISLERYMKCARGVCGSCELDGLRVCVDGPVFTYRQLKGGDFGKRARSKSGKRVGI